MTRRQWIVWTIRTAAGAIVLLAIFAALDMLKGSP